jgi:hypothetical protein
MSVFYAECHNLAYYAEYHHAECHYTQWCYTESHYAECDGAILSIGAMTTNG